MMVNILIHTGVSGLANPERVEKRLQLVKGILSEIAPLFQNNTSKEDVCVDAVERAIIMLEDSGLVNDGIGSVKQSSRYRIINQKYFIPIFLYCY